MDSVTQFALGAGVGLAVLGPRIGVRRAALTGGVLGTLPDLDFLLPTDGPVDSFVSHRGATHSLLVQAAVAPLFGEAVRLLFAALRDARMRVWMAVYLCFSTHALLDAVTIYGTRILWPLWPEPVGLGALFIIDPLYTLPLLVVTLWAFFVRDWTAVFGRAVDTALVLSTAYIGWSLLAQQMATSRGLDHLRDRGVEVEEAVATPTPFNTLFWRVIAVDGPRNFNVYVPLLGAEAAVSAYRYIRWPAAAACWIGRELERDGPLGTLARFTDGLYEVQMQDDALVFADLRMGLAPRYAFRFELARRDGDGIRAVPPRRIRSDRGAPGDRDWLLAGIAGRRALRPAEHAYAVEPGSGRIEPAPRPACPQP